MVDVFFVWWINIIYFTYYKYNDSYKKDKEYIYSQNFGILDAVHIEGYFGSYRKVYAALEDAKKTGKPQTVKLELGKGVFVTYKVAPPGKNASADEMHKLCRSVLIDASYRFEKGTVLLRGAANVMSPKLAPWAGAAARLAGMPKEQRRALVEKLENAGASAFSTEDLTSNALGMMAAEAYIRKYGNGNGQPKNDKEYKDSLNEAYDHILSKAGKLYKESDAGIKRESFGSTTFIPVRTNSIKPETNGDDYLKKIEAERIADAKKYGVTGEAKKGTGWELVSVEGGGLFQKVKKYTDIVINKVIK